MLDAQRILRTIKLKIRKSIKSNVFFNLEGEINSGIDTKLSYF